jgi:alginate O-acetyltransferase complex protein AlgI
LFDGVRAAFVLWGDYHGALLAVHRWWIARRPAATTDSVSVLHAAKCLATFHLVCFGWVLFRMPSLLDGSRFLWGGLRFGYEPTRAGTLAMVALAIGIASHLGPSADAWRRRFVALPPAVQGVAYGIATVIGSLIAPAGARFIYFQF